MGTKMAPSFANLTVKEVKYRRTKSVDISALSCDLGESSLCRDVLSNSHPDILSACDLDSLACNYNTTLSSVIESHAPLKTKTIVSRPTVPWYNDDIHKAKLLRRKAERKWKKTKRETDFQLFKKRRNHVTHLLNEAKRKFFTDFEILRQIWLKWRMNKVIASRKFHVKAWKMTLHMPMNPWLMKNGYKRTKATFVWLAVCIFSVQSSCRAQESKQRWLLPRHSFFFCSRANFSRRTRTENACYAG